MRSLSPLAIGLVALSLVIPAVAQQTPAPTAQDYEMTTYFMAFLKKAPNAPRLAGPEAQKVQQAHLANISAMAAAGKLLIAGPFTDSSDFRGIFIFTTKTIEEAQTLCMNDPAVKAGLLITEVHPWYAAKNVKVTPTAAK